jgi:PAS domain S-box-containing protein
VRFAQTLLTHSQALGLSEEKFRKIFEMSGSLIAIHSIPDGCLMDVNPAWERTFGYSRKEVLGKLRPDLASTQGRDGFVQWVSSLKIGDAGIGDDPEVVRSRSGSAVHCLYSWTALELNGRECVLVIGQDITARVQAEEELNRNREVLINQERLKAVGELASGIAHDLNNSLNALRLRVELLCADSALLPRHNDSLQLISRIVAKSLLRSPNSSALTESERWQLSRPRSALFHAIQATDASAPASSS